MDTGTIIAIVVVVAVFAILIGWLSMRTRRRHVIERYEDESLQRQELAADRAAEADAVVADAARERRMAEEAAERARELQAEADRRAETALEREADAQALTEEADQHSVAAEEARLEAESRR